MPEDLITVRLNEASIAQALAKHYSDIGDHESASGAALEMQRRLDEAGHFVDVESVSGLPDLTHLLKETDGEADFDIDIVEP